jgi:hypothetical protein
MAATRHGNICRDDLKRVAFRLDPALWSEHVQGMKLDAWQEKLVRASRGSRTVALTFRQAGKTTAAGIIIAHVMHFEKGTTSLVLSPTQRQSAELLRKVRGMLLTAGERLSVDNTFSIELANGSRCLAMPGSDDGSIRGLSVSGVLCVDEAARASDTLYAAARPMLARHPEARLVLISTAWISSGFFYRAWSVGGDDWLKIEARPEETQRLSQKFLDEERRALGETAFMREYQNQFDSTNTRFFEADLLARAFNENYVSESPTTVGPDEDSDPVIHQAPMFAGLRQ